MSFTSSLSIHDRSSALSLLRSRTDVWTGTVVTARLMRLRSLVCTAVSPSFWITSSTLTLLFFFIDVPFFTNVATDDAVLDIVVDEPVFVFMTVTPELVA